MNAIEKKNYMNWVEEMLTNKNEVAMLTFPLIPVRLKLTDKILVHRLYDFYDDIDSYAKINGIEEKTHYVDYNDRLYEFGVDGDENKLYYVVMTKKNVENTISFDTMINEEKYKAFNDKLEELFNTLDGKFENNEEKEKFIMQKVINYRSKRN